MKIRKFIFVALLGLMFSLAAFQVTASAAEADPTTSPAGGTSTALTPDGTGTVIDDVTVNGKEFYTIKAEDGSIFYLIVDRSRNADNVYFLNGVTEDDLMALAQKNGSSVSSSTASGGSVSSGSQKQPSEPTTPPAPAQKSGPNNNTTTIIFVGIGVAVVGGVGFYLKIVKPRKRGKNSDDDDEFDEYEDSNDEDDRSADEEPDDEPEDS